MESTRCRGALDKKCFKDAVAVVMVRHPYSWVRSTEHAPYDIDCGGHADGAFHGPCYYVVPTGHKAITEAPLPRVPNPLCSSAATERPCWGSLVEGWNSHVRGYDILASIFREVV